MEMSQQNTLYNYLIQQMLKNNKIFRNDFLVFIGICPNKHFFISNFNNFSLFPLLIILAKDL
jgi:hypothetical protein